MVESAVAFAAVFFDLYGTLLVYGDMERAWADWLAALDDGLLALGSPVDRRRLEAACEGFFGRPEPRPADDGLTVYERRLAQLCATLGVSMSAVDLGALATRTVAAWQRQIPLDREAEPVLASLHRRLPLALVSNFDHPPHVRRLLEESGLARHFDTIVVSAEVGVKKPDPSIFAGPLAQLGVVAAEVAYVGDSPEDVTAARGAGLVPILVARPGGPSRAEVSDFRTRSDVASRPEATPAHVVSSLGQVIPLILES